MLYFEHFETVWKNLGCYIFNTLKQCGKSIEMLYFQHFETVGGKNH